MQIASIRLFSTAFVRSNPNLRPWDEITLIGFLLDGFIFKFKWWEGLILWYVAHHYLHCPMFVLYVLFKNSSCNPFLNDLQLFNQNLHLQADSSQSIACDSKFGSFMINTNDKTMYNYRTIGPHLFVFSSGLMMLSGNKYSKDWYFSRANPDVARYKVLLLGTSQLAWLHYLNSIGWIYRWSWYDEQQAVAHSRCPWCGWCAASAVREGGVIWEIHLLAESHLHQGFGGLVEEDVPTVQLRK